MLFFSHTLLDIKNIRICAPADGIFCAGHSARANCCGDRSSSLGRILACAPGPAGACAWPTNEGSWAM